MVTSLVIALCRPYNKMYMNVLDSLLLAYLGILCHMISSYPGFQITDNFVYTFLVTISLPFACFMLFFIQRGLWKILKSSGFKQFAGRVKTFFRSMENTRFTNENAIHPASFIEQPLIDSTCASYGTINVK